MKDQLCPICNERMVTSWETTGHMPHPSTWQWYQGLYVCANHGTLKISGKIADDGERITRCWLPPCPVHSFHFMVEAIRGVFKCTECDRQQIVLGGKFVDPAVVEARRVAYEGPVTWQDVGGVA